MGSRAAERQGHRLPVLVAGDPERRNAANRMQAGIPVGANLLAQVRSIAATSGADWVMD